MDIEKLKTSLAFLKGAIDELDAITTYTNLIISNLDQKVLAPFVCEEKDNEEKTAPIDEKVIANYTEIIGDELNHLARFVNMYVDYSTIQPKED